MSCLGFKLKLKIKTYVYVNVWNSESVIKESQKFWILSP